MQPNHRRGDRAPQQWNIPVICPFLWKGSKAIKPVRPTGRRWMPSPEADPHLDLHLNPHWGQGRRAAQQDQRAQAAEAERLAYVACTRARHLLVLGWPGVDLAEPANPLSPWLVEGGLERDLPLHRCEMPAGNTITWQQNPRGVPFPWSNTVPPPRQSLGPRELFRLGPLPSGCAAGDA